MRYQMIPRFMLPALALAAFAITTTGCAMEDQATSPPEDSGQEETATNGFPLAECDTTDQCEIADHATFFLNIYGPTGLGVLNEAQAQAIAECLGDGVCAEDGFCRIPDFSMECITLLPGIPGDACLNDLACDDENACTTDSCVSSRCVSTTTPDPSPENANQCESRTCDTETGWGNTPLPPETACDDDDECTIASACDGMGMCVSDTSTAVCCYGFDECAGSCAEGELDACRAPTSSETELTGDFGRCVCYPEEGFSNEDSNSCCLGHGGLGCTPPSEMSPSSEDVCSTDPWCCDTGWDAICASLYASANPGVCEYFTNEVCDDTIDNDRDNLVDCDDTDCAESEACVPPTTDVTLAVNEGFLIRGCLGETELAAPAYLACDVTEWDDTGRSSYTLMEGQGLLFNVRVSSTGDTLPRITIVGPPPVYDLRGFTGEDIFVDPTLAGLSCAVVSTSFGGQNWLCVNGALSSAAE